MFNSLFVLWTLTNYNSSLQDDFKSKYRNALTYLFIFNFIKAICHARIVDIWRILDFSTVWNRRAQNTIITATVPLETTDHPIIILCFPRGKSYSSRIIEVIESLLLFLLLFFLPRCSPSNPARSRYDCASRRERDWRESAPIIREPIADKTRSSLSESSNRFSHPRRVHRTHVSHAMQTPLLRASISRFSQGGATARFTLIFLLRRYFVTGTSSSHW